MSNPIFDPSNNSFPEHQNTAAPQPPTSTANPMAAIAAQQAKIAAMAGVSNGDQAAQFQVVPGANTNFSVQIPVDAIPLPSKGLVYPATHAFFCKDSVEIRGMTTREEDILTSAALIKKGTVINELIRACLMDRSVDVTSLLSGDRNALMIAIRATGYGATYSPSITCPVCEAKNELKVNLGDLKIKNLQISPVEQGKNMFSYTLQNGKDVITFRFLTGADEEEILAQANMRKKKGIQTSTLVTSRLLASIVAINGNSDRTIVAQFVNNCPAFESNALRHFIDKHEPGVDMAVDFSCQSCEHYEEVVLPMDASFFWPNSKR